LKYTFRFREKFDEPNDDWLKCIEATSDELLGTYLSAFRPRGVPGPTSKLSLRVPAQMGRRETEHKGKQKREPRLVLSCAQGGCACSRGLQAFARERARACPSARPPARPPFLYEGPGPSFYRCKEEAQVYNRGV
jgi:hypothetical protein